jgi:hypothetical protein
VAALVGAPASDVGGERSTGWIDLSGGVGWDGSLAGSLTIAIVRSLMNLKPSPVPLNNWRSVSLTDRPASAPGVDTPAVRSAL